MSTRIRSIGYSRRSGVTMRRDQHRSNASTCLVVAFAVACLTGCRGSDGGAGDGAEDGVGAARVDEAGGDAGQETGEPAGPSGTDAAADLPPPATLEEAAARVLGPDAGLVAMDPATGEIEAIVRPEIVVRHRYPPGSTFKLLTAYALLDDDLIGPHDEVSCGGAYTVDGTLYPCSVRTGHGPTNLVGALANSCNVFFYEQGRRLGLRRIREAVDTFRLLEPTGFDPAEPRGRFPDDATESDAFLLGAGNTSRIEVTPLSMLVAFSGLVGDGQCRLPWRGDRPRGGVRASLPALFEYQALLVDGLEGAVEYGTATAAAVPGETVLGKTGTMLRADDPTAVVNWFLGYLVERRLAICVVDTRARGVEPAAAAFGQIVASLPGPPPPSDDDL